MKADYIIIVHFHLAHSQALDRRIAELNDAEEQAKCKALQDNASVSSLDSLGKK